MDLANLADQVSGRACEILALPLVHVSPDYVPVGPREFGVDVEQGLHVVVASGNVLQARGRESERALIDHRQSAGALRLYVNGEHGTALRSEPRFGFAGR